MTEIKIDQHLLHHCVCASRTQPVGWSRVAHFATFKPDYISIQFWNPHLMSDVVNCKVETRYDLLQKLQKSKRGQEMNIGYRREPVIWKVFSTSLSACLKSLSTSLLFPSPPGSETRAFHGLRKAALCKKSFFLSQVSLWMVDREVNSRPRSWGALPPSIPLFSGHSPQDCEDTRCKSWTSQVEDIKGTPGSPNREEICRGLKGRRGPRPSSEVVRVCCYLL